MATTDGRSSSDLTAAGRNGESSSGNGYGGASGLLLKPWTTIPAATSDDIEDDNEVRRLLVNSDPSRTSCYPGSYKLTSGGRRSSNCSNSTNTPTQSTTNNSPLSSSTNMFRTTRRNRNGLWVLHGWGTNSALFLLGLAVLITFLMGLLIGYYVRVGGRSDKTEGDPLSGLTGKDTWIYPQDCDWNPRQPNPCASSPDTHLESIHGNIMYYVNGNRMMDFIRNFPTRTAKQSGRDWDKKFTDHIQQEFYRAGLDKVEVHNYNVVVATPNPSEPSHMDIVNGHGQVQLSVNLKTVATATNSNNSFTSSASCQTKASYRETVDSYSSQLSGDNLFKGFLFYANFGNSMDFSYLKKLKANLSGQIVLLRTGKLSIEDKLNNARRAGVYGVLLYTDPESNSNARWKAENHTKSDSYIISYNPSGERNRSDVGRSQAKPLQVYNISAALALQVLSTLSGTAAPLAWWGSLNTTYNIGTNLSAEGLNSLHLKFDSCLKTVSVSNVVGTLYGKNQPDEQVLIGTPRLYGTNDAGTFPLMNGSISSQFQMASLSGTAMLLELLHSLLHVRDLEGWYPQRTIKFYSWGTATGSDDAGIREYLKKNSLIVNSRGVGYVELLDMAGKWCNHLLTRADAISTAAILRAMKMVPDPNEPEMSISATYFHRKSGLSLPLSNSVYSSVSDQLTDRHTEMMSNWLPSIQLTCTYSPENIKVGETDHITSSDSSHHYRYHMAVTRVSSLVLLAMSDRIRHGYSLEHLATAVKQQVGHFVERCRTVRGLTFKSLDDAMSALLAVVVTIRHPVTLKIWKAPGHGSEFGQKSMAGRRLQWLMRNCRRELLLLHRILAPLTRLNDTSASLESLRATSPSLETGSTAAGCSQPVLDAITSRLVQAWRSLTD